MDEVGGKQGECWLPGQALEGLGSPDPGFGLKPFAALEPSRAPEALTSLGRAPVCPHAQESPQLQPAQRP